MNFDAKHAKNVKKNHKMISKRSKNDKNVENLEKGPLIRNYLLLFDTYFYTIKINIFRNWISGQKGQKG